MEQERTTPIFKSFIEVQIQAPFLSPDPLLEFLSNFVVSQINFVLYDSVNLVKMLAISFEKTRIFYK